MRTLIAAAEPEPPPRISFTSTTGTATSTAIVWWQVPTQTVPREPYRTTAYVGEPVKEIAATGYCPHCRLTLPGAHLSDCPWSAA